jgi:hypothetical protein
MVPRFQHAGKRFAELEDLGGSPSLHSSANDMAPRGSEERGAPGGHG